MSNPRDRILAVALAILTIIGLSIHSYAGTVRRNMKNRNRRIREGFCDSYDLNGDGILDDYELGQAAD
jgi:hypothetical protein